MDVDDGRPWTRVLAAFLQPEVTPVLLLLIGIALLWTRWHRLGRWLATLVALGFVALLLLPVAAWLTLPLERRFPVMTEVPPDAAGIVGLTGTSTDTLSARFGQAQLGDDAERLTTLVALARRHPDLPVYLTGDGVEHTLNLLQQEHGLPPGRIRMAGRAGTTYTSAVALKAELGDAATGRWVLVTSASHMPRSMGTFRRVGWDVVAWPVDHRIYRPIYFHGLRGGLPSQWRQVHLAVYEWVGLAAYRAMGRTDDLFPGIR